MEHRESWFSPSDEFSVRTPPMSDDQQVIAYLEWCRDTRGRTTQTLRSYTSTLYQFLVWCQGRSLDAMTREDMEEFMTRKRERRGKGRMGSPATRKREATTLRAFYQWRVDSGKAATSPAVALIGPRVHNVNPRPVPEDAWIRLWCSTELHPIDRVFLGLGYFVGLRRFEMAQLRCDQVTPTKIVNFHRKGGGEDTTPWLDMVEIIHEKLPHLVGAPQSMIGPMLDARQGEGSLLPWGTNPQVLNKRLYSIQSRLGAPEDEWVTPHQLRHSCATNLLRAGVPLHLVSRVLNHSNPQVTMRYVKAGGEELREWRRSGGQIGDGPR